MENNLTTVENVRGFIDDNGVVMLNAEDVARGWGFTTVAKSGNVTIRWARVNKYLKDFGFPPLMEENPHTIGKNDYIPENMVYRLGFKASNEVAQKFQAKLADEILPSIRKTGQYIAKPALPDFTNPAIAARAWADQFEKRELAEAKVKELEPKAEQTEKFIERGHLIGMRALAKELDVKESDLRYIVDKILKWRYKQGKSYKAYKWVVTEGFMETKDVAPGFTHDYFTIKGRMRIEEELGKVQEAIGA